MTAWSGSGAPSGAAGGAGLTADPDGMRTAAGGFDTVADAVDRLTRTLQADLAAEGACWGGDEPGATFAATYVPATTNLDTALAALTGLLRDVRDGVVDTADALERTDSGGAHRLTATRRPR